jgi:ABC-type branched-subunit amino acid transport system substrate-binding protein
MKSKLVVVGVMLISACSKEPRRIGVWMGPTGANVARMAASSINYTGGVAGRRLAARVVSQRVVSFGELTPEVLKVSLDSIVGDTTVLAMITRMGDSVTNAAAEEMEKRGVPYLVGTPVSEAYVKAHPHAFLLVPTIDEEAEFLAQQALHAKEPRRVVMLSVREPHADSMVAAITRSLARRGITPTFASTFSQSADEYNLQAKAAEISTYRPTVMYFVGRSPSLFVMHGTIRNKSPDMLLLASNLVESFHVYGNPGWKYTGLHFVRYLDPLTTSDSLVVGLRDRLWGWIGRNELNSEAAITYDGIRALADVMNSGAVTRDAIAQKLRSSYEFKGVMGPMSFGPEQRVKRVLQLAEVKSDTIVTVTTSAQGLAVSKR